MAVDVIARGLGAQASKKVNELSSKISSVSGGVKYLGAVDYYKNLPSKPKLGDGYTVKFKGDSGTLPSGVEYVWGKYEGVAQWIPFGGAMIPECPVNVNGVCRLQATVQDGTVIYQWVQDNTLSTSDI